MLLVPNGQLSNTDAPILQIVKGEFRQVFAWQNIDDFCRIHAVIVVARGGDVDFIARYFERAQIDYQSISPPIKTKGSPKKDCPIQELTLEPAGSQ